MNKYLTILRFLFVGGTTALIYLGLTFLLVEAVAMSTTLASSISYTLGASYNYLMHYHWTFATDAPHGGVLIKYLLMCLGGFVINGLIMHFGVQLLTTHYMVIQCVAAVAVVCWNLLASTFWVFKKA